MEEENHWHSIAEGLLAGFKDQYDALAANCRNLESKASGVVTISGIFLAGLFALAREKSPQYEMTERVLMSLALAAFVIALFLALKVVWVQNFKTAPLGTSLATLVADLAQRYGQEIDRQTYANFLSDQANAWKEANASIEVICNTKGSNLFASQAALSVGMVLFISSTFLRIWNIGMPNPL